MYWCACVRILLLQHSQTFESTILVFIIVVRLHSDAYLRSLTLSHKMGGEKMCRISFFLVVTRTLNRDCYLALFLESPKQ